MTQGFVTKVTLPLPVAQGGTSTTGSTGTGSVVLSTSPSFVTPKLGTPASGVMTNLTGDRTGSSTDDWASAGKVGEYIFSSVLAASALSVVTGTSKTITSILLSAGDWDVAGVIVTKPAAGTITINLVSSISLVDNTGATRGATNGIASFRGTTPAGVAQSLPVPDTRFSFATPTIVYLIAQVGFNTSTMAAYGFIGARRAR